MVGQATIAFRCKIPKLILATHVDMTAGSGPYRTNDGPVGQWMQPPMDPIKFKQTFIVAVPHHPMLVLRKVPYLRAGFVRLLAEVHHRRVAQIHTLAKCNFRQ